MIKTEIFKLLNNLKKGLKNKNNLHEPYLDTHDKKYVVESILKKQVSTYGYYTRLFEIELKKYLNTDNIIATSSGTAAMHAIIESLKLERGDEVFVQSLNFIASINCLLYCGLTPHFIDSSISLIFINKICFSQRLRACELRDFKLVEHLFLVFLTN